MGGCQIIGTDRVLGRIGALGIRRAVNVSLLHAGTGQQGGVALGLASVISETLNNGNEPELASLVVSVIVIGTVFSETLGTVTARYGLTKAGEIIPPAVEYPSVPGIEPVKPVFDDEHWRTVHTRD